MPQVLVFVSYVSKPVFVEMSPDIFFFILFEGVWEGEGTEEQCQLHVNSLIRAL